MKKQYKSPKIKLIAIEAGMTLAAASLPVDPEHGVLPEEAEAKRFSGLIIDDSEEEEEWDEL